VNPMAIAFGCVLAAAGWLGARAVTLARVEWLHSRLPVPRGMSSEPWSGLPRPVWLRDRAASRSWPGSPWSYAGTLVATMTVGGWLGSTLVGPVGGFAGAVAGPVAVEAVLSRGLAARRGRAEERLRETVQSLAAAVRAGLSVRRAVEEAASDAGPPLSGALRRVAERLAMGARLEDSLEEMAGRLELPDLRLVVTVLVVHRRTGGDLPTMLDEVGAVIGDRVRSRREVRALTAQGRASGAVLAVLPVAFVALLSGTGGDALGAFYRSPAGAALLLAGLVFDVLGFLWIRRIVARTETGP
jgi:tight adherence protein B